MDARIALIFYLLLLLAAVVPVAMGWMALLPHEREPFATPGAAPEKKLRDRFAIFLLANISLTVLLRVPGVEREFRSLNLIARIFGENAEQALMFVFIWIGFVPWLAAAYSIARPNQIRFALVAGGTLAAVLWLAGPWLISQIAAQT